MKRADKTTRVGTEATPATLAEMSAAISAGRATPVDLVSEAIRSIQAWQPTTNAASQIWADEALAAADALRPEPAGPLHGIPVLVKELFDVAGHETTGCCEAFRGNIATVDAWAVTRLREAGAIILGKTNMHELAASGTNHISACGATHNPWAPDRLTGGSSGGSAAAVATRSVPFTLGTDTAGSIRVPSSCGTVGLKPTHGRLPMTGTMPLSRSLGCIGPMAATVDDLALGYAVLTDRTPPIPPAAPSLRGLRIGRIREGYFARWVHPAIRGALDHVADVLHAAQAELVDAHLPEMDGALHTWGDIAWPEFAYAYPDLDLHRVGKQITGHYRYGQQLDARAQAAAHEHAARIQGAFARTLREVDALLLPATAYTAPRFVDDEVDVGDGETLNVFRGGPVWFTCPVDIAMLPALSFPAGFDPAGLPLGVQLVGRFADEWTLLRIGAAFQERTTHHLRSPSLSAVPPQRKRLGGIGLTEPTSRTGVPPQLSPEALAAAQKQTLSAPRRRYSVAARTLFVLLDRIYGRKRSVAKSKVLEIIARVPYQAWEHVGYIAATHVHEELGLTARVHGRVLQARAQQDNELWHLIILEELLARTGRPHARLKFFWLPQLVAFAYYHLSWLLYVIRPKWSYRLNADFEDHAEHEYMLLVDEHPEWETEPYGSDFADEYGTFESLADLFRQIGHDERVHKEESLAQMTEARFQ